MTLWVKVKVLGKLCILFQQGFGPLGLDSCSAPGKGSEVREAALFVDLSKMTRQQMT